MALGSRSAQRKIAVNIEATSKGVDSLAAEFAKLQAQFQTIANLAPAMDRLAKAMEFSNEMRANAKATSEANKKLAEQKKLAKEAETATKNAAREAEKAANKQTIAQNKYISALKLTKQQQDLLSKYAPQTTGINAFREAGLVKFASIQPSLQARGVSAEEQNRIRAKIIEDERVSAILASREVEDRKRLLANLERQNRQLMIANIGRPNGGGITASSIDQRLGIRNPDDIRNQLMMEQRRRDIAKAFGGSVEGDDRAAKRVENYNRSLMRMNRTLRAMPPKPRFPSPSMKEKKDLDNIVDSYTRLTHLLFQLQYGTQTLLLFTGVGQLTEAADRYKNIETSMARASANAKEFSEGMKAVFDIANETNQTVESIGGFYTKIAVDASRLGISTQDVAQITRTVAVAGAVSGAQATTTEQAIYQFTQGIQSNRFGGDEFRSVSEGIPTLLRAISRGIYGEEDVGRLRADSQAGKLTAKAITDALLSPDVKASIDELSNYIPRTFAGSLNRISNGFTKFAGDIDKVTGASAQFSDLSIMLYDQLSRSNSELRQFLSVLTLLIPALAAAKLAASTAGIVGGLAGRSRSAFQVTRGSGLDDQMKTFKTGALFVKEADGIGRLYGAVQMLGSVAPIAALSVLGLGKNFLKFIGPVGIAVSLVSLLSIGFNKLTKNADGSGNAVNFLNGLLAILGDALEDNDSVIRRVIQSIEDLSVSLIVTLVGAFDVFMGYIKDIERFAKTGGAVIPILNELRKPSESQEAFKRATTKASIQLPDGTIVQSDLTQSAMLAKRQFDAITNRGKSETAAGNALLDFNRDTDQRLASSNPNSSGGSDRGNRRAARILKFFNDVEKDISKINASLPFENEFTKINDWFADQVNSLSDAYDGQKPPTEQLERLNNLKKMRLKALMKQERLLFDYSLIEDAISRNANLFGTTSLSRSGAIGEQFGSNVTVGEGRPQTVINSEIDSNAQRGALDLAKQIRDSLSRTPELQEKFNTALATSGDLSELLITLEQEKLVSASNLNAIKDRYNNLLIDSIRELKLQEAIEGRIQERNIEFQKQQNTYFGTNREYVSQIQQAYSDLARSIESQVESERKLGEELFNKRVERIKKLREIEMAYNSNPMNGVAESLQEYYSGLQNVAQQAQQITSNFLQGIEESFNSVILTGKANLGDVARTLLKDLTSMFVKQAIMKPITEQLAGFFNFNLQPDIQMMAQNVYLTGLNGAGGPGQLGEDKLAQFPDKLQGVFQRFLGDFGGSFSNIFRSVFSSFGGGGGGSGVGSFISTALQFIPKFFGFHSGGTVGMGGSLMAANPAVFRNAIRYHTGTNNVGMPALASNEVPAILKRGETVLTSAQQRSVAAQMNAQPTSNNITFAPSINVEYNTSGQNSSEEDAQQIGKLVNAQIETKFNELMMKNMRPGGALYNYRAGRS